MMHSLAGAWRLTPWARAGRGPCRHAGFIRSCASRADLRTWRVVVGCAKSRVKISPHATTAGAILHTRLLPENRQRAQNRPATPFDVLAPSRAILHTLRHRRLLPLMAHGSVGPCTAFQQVSEHKRTLNCSGRPGNSPEPLVRLIAPPEGGLRRITGRRSGR